MSEQIYSEEEIAKILRKAIELETERSTSGRKGSGKGLTISELEEIAADSGIDPGLIQLAAKEIEPSHHTLSGIKSDEQKGAVVRGETVFSERWIHADATPATIKEALTELNHRYDTSEDDISWWDNLWNNYAGKARVRKTGNSTEWHYTDESANYTIRVLLQRRGEKFRVRVSKKLLWGIDWQDMPKLTWLMAPGLLLSGGLIGYFTIEPVYWGGAVVGAGIGLLLFSLLFPIVRKITHSYINKHKQEVTLLADDLSDFIQELESEESVLSDNDKEKHSSRQNFRPEKIIEIDDSESDQPEKSEVNHEQSSGDRLKNTLRE